MAATRRMGAPASKTRSDLLDTAERIMRDEGYAAVTSRRLASCAGLSPQIVYYYFTTMDELFEALFARLAEDLLAAIEAAAEADEPLLAMWELSCDPSRAAIMAEFLTLSNHRKGLQTQIATFGQAYNQQQTAIVAATLARKGLVLPDWPADILASIFENLARGFAFGDVFAIGSHVRAREHVTVMLEKLAGLGIPAGTVPASLATPPKQRSTHAPG